MTDIVMRRDIGRFKDAQRGFARIRSTILQPGNSTYEINTVDIRWGVLCRSTGVPEQTSSGHQLLYHEGIGDPQIEQLTLDPTSGAVGQSWPFVKGSCPF